MRRFFHQFILSLFITFGVLGQTTSLKYGQTFDVLTSNPVQTNIFTPSDKTRSIQDAVFSPDGGRLYVAANDLNAVLQYAVSESFELGSEVILEGELAFNTDGGIVSLAFNSDGSKLYRAGIRREEDNSFTSFVNEYNLETAYDVTTASLIDFEQLDLGVEAAFSEGLRFNDSGSMLFVSSVSTDSILTYSLNVPFDISSSAGLVNAFDSPNLRNTGFNFNTDGTKLYIVNVSRNLEVHQYELAEAYNLSAVSFTGFFEADVDFFPTDISFDSEGNKMFVSGGGSVWQFQINGGFAETLSNTGAVAGEAIITIEGEGAFSSAGQNLEFGVDYSIDNLPEGLESSLSVFDDGTYATLRLSGAATERENVNDVSNLIFTFESSAFDGNIVSPVENATSAESGFIIDFMDNNVPIIDNPPLDVRLASGFSIYTIELAGIASDKDEQAITYSVSSANESVATAQIINGEVVLSEMGTGMTDITITATDQEEAAVSTTFNVTISNPYLVYQEPFDLLAGQLKSSASIDLSNVTGASEAITFDQLGTRLFFLFTSSAGNSVKMYQLSNSFDFNGIVSLEAEWDLDFLTAEGDPVDIGFDSSGDRFYVTLEGENRIEQFDLTQPYDLTSPTSSGSFSLNNEQERKVTGTSFGSGGSVLLVTYQSGELETYMLSEAYNIAGSLTFQSRVSINDDLSGPLKMIFSNDGRSLIGTNFGSIAIFELSEAFEPASGISLREKQGIFAGGFIPAYLAISSDEMTLFSGGFEKVSQFEMPARLAFENSTILEEAVLQYQGEFTNEPGPIELSPDGSKFYVIAGSTLYQYLMEVPFDLSGGLLDETRTSVFLKNAEDFSFSKDGTKLFLTGSSNGVVNNSIQQYSLSEAYDIESGVELDGEFFLQLNVNIPTGHVFSDDGTRLLVADIQTNRVNQYLLSEPFDVTQNVTFETSKLVVFGRTSGMKFSNDGKKLLLTDGSAGGVVQYTLGEAYNLNGPFVYEGYLNLGLPDTFQKGITFNASGSRMYISLLRGEQIVQYHIGGSFDEKPENEGEMVGSLEISIDGASFVTDKDLLVNEADYSISGLPSGLTPQISVNSGGGSVNLTLSGKADSNADSDDLDDLKVDFTSSAFADISVGDLGNTVSDNLHFSIDFFDSLFIPSPEPPLSSLTNQQELYLYPNPASDFLVIGSNHSVEDETIRIYLYSSQGILLRKKELYDNSKDSQNGLSVDVSDLSEGIYLIKIEKGTAFETFKFIKE